MRLARNGREPVVSPEARVAATAVLAGDVRVGPRAVVLHGAVLTADGGPVEVGADTIVMENAVLRGTPRHPLTLGRHVLVGPRAYVSGCTVEDSVFLATGSTVFNGAVLGEGSEVRINGTVHILTELAPRATVPIGWVAVGRPTRILPPGAHDEIWAAQKPLNFPKEVFGLERPPPGESKMPELTRRYGAYLRSHRSDVPLEGQ